MARSRPSKKALPRKRGVEKKTLSPYGPQGQRGIHFIGDIAGEMRSWSDPTQATEVGLDGYIELLDPHTGHPKNVTLAVQSKTVVAVVARASIDRLLFTRHFAAASDDLTVRSTHV